MDKGDLLTIIVMVFLGWVADKLTQAEVARAVGAQRPTHPKGNKVEGRRQ